MATREMRAWVYRGPGILRLESHPKMEPGADQIRIHVARAGICGSDVHGYTGRSGLRYPGNIMGHEGSGIVDAFGSDVAGWDVGQPVTFIPTLPCDGTCGHLAENQCERLQIVGCSDGAAGAFADYMLVPASRVVALGGLSFEAGASVEPIAVGLHAARRVGVRNGHRVLIIGGGTIGLAAAQAARLEGAGDVAVSEPQPDRRGIATTLGFRVIDPKELASASQFDLAIDAVGIPATIGAALTSVRRGGTVCVVGLGAQRVEFRLFDLVFGDRALVGSDCYTDAEFHEALHEMIDGRLGFDAQSPLIVGFEAIGDAMERLAQGSEHSLKVMMTTGIP